MSSPAASLAGLGPAAGPPAGALAPGAGAVGVLTGPHGLPARQDVGVGPALLAHAVAAGEGSWLRVYRPAPAVAFSRLDTLRPGFRAAAEASLAHGFTPVLRAPGGRPVAYHGGALCIDFVTGSRQPPAGVMERFAAMADVLVRALGLVGVDAAVGPVPGEYCPGQFSLHAQGGPKLAGSAQRIVRGGWLMGVVILVSWAEPVRQVVADVYRRLELDCDPATVGAVQELAPGVSVGDVAAAVRIALSAAGLEVAEANWPPGVLASAAQAAPELPAPPESPDVRLGPSKRG